MLSETERILAEVLDERAEQDSKWGQQNHAASVWSDVLMEEVGEWSEAVLEHRVAVMAPHRALREWKGQVVEDPESFFRGQMRKEAVQIAAVAVAMVEWMDRGMPVAPGMGEDTSGQEIGILWMKIRGLLPKGWTVGISQIESKEAEQGFFFSADIMPPGPGNIDGAHTEYGDSEIEAMEKVIAHIQEKGEGS